MKKIILLIPHFNNPVGLKSSILSINEDIPLDILIVDDGSNDKIDLADLQSNYLCGAIEIEYLSKNYKAPFGALLCGSNFFNFVTIFIGKLHSKFFLLFL